MAAQRDYYQVVGVAETATTDEIKKAFRRLAKQHHPDRNPNNPQAAERFKEINEAHDVLSDAEKRKKYDQLRRYGAFAGPGGFGGAGAGARRGRGAPQDSGDRKSTRLNSSHLVISYAVFCLKKKKKKSERAAGSSRAPMTRH